ncbi:SDR family oxidoreductase [Gemmata sp.]|uniref:SDR family oxidoreductase n=1 Tax=Gemmata sp. TaxID=1914242 RepID=UPI003F714840
MTPPEPAAGSVFVTGATGYVGGRLVPALLAAGYGVRCLAREPRKLDERPWRADPNVRVVAGDMSDVDHLSGQLEGCSAAYYLVHSMEAKGGEYAAQDRLLASNFARAAARAGVRRIVYLGGLGELGAGLSEHLRSRREVETGLASTGIPVTTFRAAMIIGAGSASFEILRYLVERLPVMVTPSWVKTESQPVAIDDVLHWLVRCLGVPETAGTTLEIGGPDALPYRELMRIMAEELHLPRRLVVPIPILTPRLSSLWIGLVTPVSYRIARPLAEGLRNRVVVTSGETQRLMPHTAAGARDAIRQAIKSVEANAVETRWSAAGTVPGDPEWAGGTVFTDRRSVEVQADPRQVFAAVCRIGGGHGWYAGDVLWRVRGWMDTVAGGPGLRRGRRNSERVEFGEALDFWRVAGVERDRSLSLRAEMKLPGEAKLNFEVHPGEGGGGTRLTMTALFRPRGLFGLLYWYAVVPLHGIVFGGMLRGIRKTAEALYRAEHPAPAAAPPAAPAAPGYGRARLWLGMSAVGTLVALAAVALALGLPGRAAPDAEAPVGDHLLGLLGFVLLYAVVQLPFDLLGGYLLPRRYGRSHPSPGRYLSGLARGVAAHTTVLLAAAVALLFAGRYGGAAGTAAAGALLALAALRGRVALASAVARLELTPSAPEGTSPGDRVPVALGERADEGFTGSVVGVLRPRLHLLPMKWREVLGSEGLRVALRRRCLAVLTGSWRRGRVLALLFTLTGVAAAALLVGPDRLGTAAGTIELSLWFTLWSFLGLLTLPTLSRRGVAEVDERLLSEGCPREALEKVVRQLDDLQDGERDRSPLIETIFHPVPSVTQRLRGPHSHGRLGYWDAARTAVYLSPAGLGLLGRAVHCNCGRPALWVFLPAD